MTLLVLRILLAATLTGMSIVALAYLCRRRRLSSLQLAGWGLLALAVPAVGPFLVLLARPGQSR